MKPAEAGQRAALPEPRQEDRQQRRLARLPLAGQERDIVGGEVAVPQPLLLARLLTELAAPVAEPVEAGGNVVAHRGRGGEIHGTFSGKAKMLFIDPTS